MRPPGAQATWSCGARLGADRRTSRFPSGSSRTREQHVAVYYLRRRDSLHVSARVVGRSASSIPGRSKGVWSGHGTARRDIVRARRYAIWHFWTGEDRRLRGLVREHAGAARARRGWPSTPRTRSSTSGSSRMDRGVGRTSRSSSTGFRADASRPRRSRRSAPRASASSPRGRSRRAGRTWEPDPSWPVPTLASSCERVTRLDED